MWHLGDSTLTHTPLCAPAKALFRLPNNGVSIRNVYVSLSSPEGAGSGINRYRLTASYSGSGFSLLCHLAAVLKPQRWLLLPFQNWGRREQSGISHSRLYLLITPGTGLDRVSEKLLFEVLVIVNHSKIGNVSGGGFAACCVVDFSNSSIAT